MALSRVSAGHDPVVDSMLGHRFGDVTPLLPLCEQCRRFQCAGYRCLGQRAGYPGRMAADFDLAGIWLFSECSGAQLRSVRRAVEDVTVPKDHILCAEGSPGLTFSTIVEGTAAVRRNGRVVARLGPGEYFGELSLLDHRPRSATVVSTSPMRLLVVDQARFEALVDSMPVLALKLMAALAARLRQADARAFG